jgi:hypothetical protein
MLGDFPVNFLCADHQNTVVILHLLLSLTQMVHTYNPQQPYELTTMVFSVNLDILSYQLHQHPHHNIHLHHDLSQSSCCSPVTKHHDDGWW